ncbi:MAG: Tat pathway signal protein, partial [Caldimonas sp.]
MTVDASRRAFLQRASALSLAGSAAPWAINLAAMGEAAAAGTPADYKALVCVFLYGGNDYGNTLVPYDTASYNAYQGMRPTLAYSQAALAPTVLAPTTALPGGRQYALAPELAPLLPLFAQNRMGVLLNVGPLIQPTTKL